MMLDGTDIALRLREIALLLTVGGKTEDAFKARAYTKASGTIERQGEGLAALVAADQLTTLEGVGKGIAGVITELATTGRSELLEKLRAEIPRGVVELSQIDGLTPRRIQILRTIGVTDAASLRAALDAGTVSALEGFGPKTTAKVEAGLERFTLGDARLALADALELGERIRGRIAADPDVREVALSGDLRRGQEIVESIALVAATDAPEAVLDRFVAGGDVTRVSARDPLGATVHLEGGARIALAVVPPSKLGLAQLVHTGGRAHVEALEKRARERGLSLATLPAADEAAVYRALDLPFHPPELRDVPPLGEPSALAELVTTDQIRGLVHVHSTYSDGKDTIEALALEADRRGIEYLTITDHSPSAVYARGVETDRLQRQWDEMDAVQAKVKVRLLRGTESDINADGSLDYPPEILDRLDVVIASIHSRHKMDRRAMTERLIRAMTLPVFKIWGHALGRLLNERDPIDCDVEAILDAIAASRAAIEINADPRRLDLPPAWIPAARARGIPFVISVDAHSAAAFAYLPFGVWMARRGGLTSREVLNTGTVESFLARVRPAAS